MVAAAAAAAAADVGRQCEAITDGYMRLAAGRADVQLVHVTLHNPSFHLDAHLGMRTHAGDDLLDDLRLHGLKHRLLLASRRGSGGCGILRQAAAGSCTQTAPLSYQRLLMLMRDIAMC